MRGTRILDKIT